MSSPIAPKNLATTSAPSISKATSPVYEKIQEIQYHENFSNEILKEHFMGYQSGKYTKKYMEVYLEFYHLSGYLSNLDYLEYKVKLKE